MKTNKVWAQVIGMIADLDGSNRPEVEAGLLHLFDLAASHDLELLRLFQLGKGWAFRVSWRPNETYEKRWNSPAYPTVQELIGRFIELLEDPLMANIFKVGDIFKYLTAEMFEPGQDVTMEIDYVQVKEIESQRGKEDRAILYFKGTEKGLVLGNKTNIRSMVALYGKDYTTWHNKPVSLYTVEISAFGKMMRVIRIRESMPSKAAVKKAQESLPLGDNNGQ